MIQSRVLVVERDVEVERPVDLILAGGELHHLALATSRAVQSKWELRIAINYLDTQLAESRSQAPASQSSLDRRPAARPRIFQRGLWNWRFERR